MSDFAQHAMTAEELNARVTVRREKTRGGYQWSIVAQGLLTGEEAASITFTATPESVVMGEFVSVTDAKGERIGHLSGAQYVRRPLGPAYVLCSITLL